MEQNNVNYQSSAHTPFNSRYNRTGTITFVLFFCILLVFTFFMIPKRNAKNIRIVGKNQLTMTLGKQNISAELSSREGISILVNNGESTSLNTGNFVVIPTEKVKYLEGKYNKDFIHCLSSGVEEAKNSLSHISLIARTTDVETQMKDLEALIKKGNLVVVNIEGWELIKIAGLKREISNYGIFVVEKIRPDVYFLVDDLKIIKEKYQ